MESLDLVVAEKKTLAEAIAAVLPGEVKKDRTSIRVGNVVLTWLYGHALEQAMPEHYDARFEKWSAEHLPILPADWKLFPKKERAAELKTVSTYLKKATRVIHAGDPDAEGQLLVDEVLQHYGNTKPVMRLLVADYDPSKVREALATMRPNTDPRFRGWSAWALCRSRLDWLFGINLTRAYTLRAQASGYRGVLPVGRVQTPTLALAVFRDIAIEQFKPVPFYKLVARLPHANGTLTVSWRAQATQRGLDSDGRLVDESAARELVNRLSGQAASVTSFAESAKKTAPPLPFDLTALQRAANRQFGYSPDEVLDAAQALYDTYKVISYPRGDSRYLSVAQHAESSTRLARLAKNLPELHAAVERADVALRSSAFNDAKVTAHHATVPTSGPHFDTSVLSECERNIYLLVARAYLAQFYPPYGYSETDISVQIGGETFTANGKRPTAQGWKDVFNDDIGEDPEDESEQRQTSLPKLTQGQVLAPASVEAEAKKTSPPAYFTADTLLGAMSNIHQYVANPAAKARLKEGQGIGTAATRASIIKDLVSRNLLQKKGKQLRATPAARALVNALPSLATDAGFTGITEQTLDLIADGRLPITAFMEKTVQLVTQLTAQAENAQIKVPVQAASAKRTPRKTSTAKKAATKATTKSARKTTTKGRGGRSVPKPRDGGIDR